MRHFQTVQQFRVGDFVLIKEIMAILIDRTLTYSRFVWTSPETPEGRFTLIPFMCT
jgi:hypothetical protein